MLEKHMGDIIEMLPNVNSLKQETLLYTISGVLFPDASAKEEITPIRRKALLAAANLVDTEIIFVNHTGLLRGYGLPTNTAGLRELAGN